MNNRILQPKRALLSVSDKTGIVEFARSLHGLGVELISTGGTLRVLQKENIPVKHVSEITDFPEVMNGRVKTLHPLLLGGILGQRDLHDSEAQAHNIAWIDLVVCNLYPFETTIQAKGISFGEALEQIDIGGPTMIRAAAKNFPWVAVGVHHSQYEEILNGLAKDGLSLAYRRNLAQKAFEHTAKYDSVIANYFNDECFPETVSLYFTKYQEPRYGENPHQSACVYRNGEDVLSVLNAKQLHGKTLSYNNLVDAQAAIDAIAEIKQPASVVIKHAIPCGMAVANSVSTAFNQAFLADEKSAFGGVVALNKHCDFQTAQLLSKRFVELIIAPSFDEAAIEILSEKVALRLLTVDFDKPQAKFTQKFLPGGMLMQAQDDILPSKNSLKLVSGRELNNEEFEEALFVWQVVKKVKSNAIVVSKNKTTLGIGGGQVSRVDAVEIALQKSGDHAHGAILASDAFFPFRDSIDLIAKAGVKCIIQPGGSKRDEEVIEAAKEHGITMLFTQIRAFNH